MAENININDFKLPDELLEAIAGGTITPEADEMLRLSIREYKKSGATFNSAEWIVKLLAENKAYPGEDYTTDEILGYVQQIWDEA